MSEILVVGGAGYIGSHVIIELIKNNKKVVVLDDLSKGSKSAILGGTFYQGCMSNKPLLKEIFTKHNVSTVMLLAGNIDVNESVLNPSIYYNNNVAYTLKLLEVMMSHNVLNIIFSSTAAIYQSQSNSTISIESTELPQNPYAKSKLMVENILKDYEKAYGLKHIIFRYFNAAGADPQGRIGFHEPATHLIPQVLKAASGRKTKLNIYGNDYNTTDGTCVRDYIHVMDLASAHLLALEYLKEMKKSSLFNLGNGKGHSVKQVSDMVRTVTKVNFKIEICPRRDGDAAYVVADSTHAENVLGWKPKYHSLEEIIKHSWSWEQNKTWH